MSVYLLALILGVVTGLRTMTAVAAVSWAAYFGRLPLQDTPFWFMGAAVTPYILTVLALGEFVTDQIPSTPSRTVPIQFGGRVVMGAFVGLLASAGVGRLVIGLGLGAVGAVIGTLGGAAARRALAAAFGRDRPAALTEDAVAIAVAAAALAVLA